MVVYVLIMKTLSLVSLICILQAGNPPAINLYVWTMTNTNPLKMDNRIRLCLINILLSKA